MFSNEEIQELMKEGKMVTKVLTRKDVDPRSDDIIIFRYTSYGTHGSTTETVYKTDRPGLYLYETTSTDRSLPNEDKIFRIGKKIEKLIANNMEKLKGLGKLEIYNDKVKYDGKGISLYLSDGEQGIWFSFSCDNDFNGKNMKILLNILKRIEKMLWEGEGPIDHIVE